MEEKMWRYWGKAGKDEGPGADYHLLVYHCLDVAAVGDVLLRRRGDMSDMFCGSPDMSPDVFRPWAVFFLSLHDIGKFSETFQGLREDIYRQLHGKESGKLYTQRHDCLGYAVWKNIWKSVKKEGGLGFAPESEWAGSKVFDPWMQLVTGHHGKPPQTGKAKYIEDFFSKEDMDSCREFIRAMAEMLLPEAEKSEPFFKDRSPAKKFRPLSWSLAGFSVLCDWIGSDSSRFPFQKEKIPLKDYWEKYALPQAEQAVAQYGILPSAKSLYVSVQHLFDYVSVPTPLQQYCHSQEISPEPQLWILEDVTGSGKTEAALTLAHRLMNLRGESGIYIGLPTMATANAMYERMGKCYRKLYADESSPSLCLAHSARHLSDLFHDSVLAEHSGEMHYKKGEKSASAHCNAWLADHRKKALLADVGIGTVDQALLGILPVRHQSLRLLGLVSKILIIDEIHAFDAYTGRLIQTLLKYQAMNGGSAILLSATLPKEMRYEMAEAFREGLGIEEEAELKSSEYPLVTMVNAKEIREHSVDTREEVKRKVEVKLLHKEEDVCDLILKSAASGHCVCWIRNTVSDAMSAFDYLGEMQSGAERLLFHSRFTLSDRLGIEGNVLDSFGEKSASEQRAGKILVATQVVEQSLDLDFDVLISDLAPMDLLIQRAGRLHRHMRDEKGNRKREKGEKEERNAPVFYVYGPEPVPDPGEKWFRSFFEKGSYVYPHTGHLWRTVRLLAEYGVIRMPGDARKLIEGVFDEEQGEVLPETLEEPSFTVEGRKMGERDMAEYNSLKIGKGYSSDNSQWYEDSRFPTRLGENTVTLYLARYAEGELTPWAAGKFPWDLSSLKVYESHLSDISPDTSADLKKKLAQLKENEKGLSEDSFVFPLVKCGKEWEGEGISKKGKRVKVRYSAERGCLIEKNQ
jgi:CRISPR-associated endonuclease/helicase Cas3